MRPRIALSRAGPFRAGGGFAVRILTYVGNRFVKGFVW